MDNAPVHRALDVIIVTTALALVGLTLYTAYFGVFPDGIQRSAHLLLVLVLVFSQALKSTFDPDHVRGAGTSLSRLWVIVAMVGGVVAAGHQLVNFDAINSRYGSILQFEIILVNDCSPDDAWAVIQRLSAEDHRIDLNLLQLNSTGWPAHIGINGREFRELL